MNQTTYKPRPLSARLQMGNGAGVRAPARTPSGIPFVLSVGKSEKLRDEDAQAIRDQESEGGLVADTSAVEASPKTKTE